MSRVVQKIGLDHEDGPDLPGLRAQAGAEIGKVEKAAPAPHHSRTPSEASGSSSLSSFLRDERVSSEARR